MFLTKSYFPNNGPMYTLVDQIRWRCPREKLPEVVALIEGAFKAAPADRIANELFKLRMLTRGREQRDAADQEAENIIWLEQLRCYPGDIVIDVLRNWPKRKDGQWWPTWHDVQEELQQRCDRRQALLNFVRELAQRPEAPPAITDQPPTPEQRARAVERWEEMRKGFGASEAPQAKEDPEAILERMLSDESPMKSKVIIGGELAKKIEAIKQGN